MDCPASRAEDAGEAFTLAGGGCAAHCQSARLLLTFTALIFVPLTAGGCLSPTEPAGPYADSSGCGQGSQIGLRPSEMVEQPTHACS